MRKTALATTLAVLFAVPALAQGTGAESQPSQTQQTGNHGGMAHGSSGGSIDLSILPQGCRDAVQQSPMSGMMQGMDMSGMMEGMDMSGMMEGMDMFGMMEGMSEHQQASMEAMMEMHGPMMAAHTIEDPDLAFSCGMIAHHAGGIAMSEIELEYGDDEASKDRARQIMADQQREIDEMTSWVEEHASAQ